MRKERREFEQLPETMQVVINNTEFEILRLRDRLDVLIHKAPTDEELREGLAEELTKAIDQLTSLRGDLTDPAILIDKNMEHTGPR